MRRKRRTDKHLNKPPILDPMTIREELHPCLSTDAFDAGLPDLGLGGGRGVGDIYAFLEVEGEDFDDCHG